MKENSHIKLLRLMFEEMPYGIYPYIIKEGGNQLSLEDAIRQELDGFVEQGVSNRLEVRRKQRRIIELRLGLFGESPHTQKETARIVESALDFVKRAQTIIYGRLRSQLLLEEFIIPSPKELRYRADALSYVESIARRVPLLERFLRDRDLLDEFEGRQTSQTEEKKEEALALKRIRAQAEADEPILKEAFEILRQREIERHPERTQNGGAGTVVSRAFNAIRRNAYPALTIEKLRELLASGDILKIRNFATRGEELATEALEIVEGILADRAT